MSAGDDVRAMLAASASDQGDMVTLRAALGYVAARLDRTDSDDGSAREAIASVIVLLAAMDTRLEAVEERLGMAYAQRQ